MANPTPDRRDRPKRPHRRNPKIGHNPDQRPRAWQGTDDDWQAELRASADSPDLAPWIKRRAAEVVPSTLPAGRPRQETRFGGTLERIIPTNGTHGAEGSGHGRD